MWMPARLTVPPGRTASSATGTSSPAGREHDGAVARRRRELGRVADPRRAELARELAVALAPREHDDLAPPVVQHLEREVRGRAEARAARRAHPAAPRPAAARGSR